MAKLRYKTHPDFPFYAAQFNVCALNEILTGKGLAFIQELEVEINGEWKDMGQAFKDHDLIINNPNTRFFEPTSQEDRDRGFTL